MFTPAEWKKDGLRALWDAHIIDPSARAIEDRRRKAERGGKTVQQIEDEMFNEWLAAKELKGFANL